MSGAGFVDSRNHPGPKSKLPSNIEKLGSIAKGIPLTATNIPEKLRLNVYGKAAVL